MGLVIFALTVLLLVVGVAAPSARVTRGPVTPWTRALAALLLLLAVVLVAFLFAEDDYTRDGRSNWQVYDVEYPAIPTIVGSVAAAVWLLRREGTRAVALAAPLLGTGAGFAAYVCFIFTTN